MALGVVGAVDEEASDGGGVSAAAYGSGLFDVGGGEGADALEGGVDAVVAESNLRFRAPARFDDELQLHAQIVALGNTSITTEINVLRRRELLVEGTLRHVCVDAHTWRKTDLPVWVRTGLQCFLAPAEAVSPVADTTS